MTIDVHSHIYFPRYVQMLRERSHIPCIVKEGDGERLIILPDERSKNGMNGRPVDSSYWNVEQKLEYMVTYGIDTAVLSLGNPWLDFLQKEDAVLWAKKLNQDLEEICSDHPNLLYGFGVLPLQDISGSLAELKNIASLSRIRGVIISTRGAGKGLDDPALDPVWKEVETLGLLLFVHPHYGIGFEHFGEHGYILNLALGFPFETTIAVIRLVFSGVLERFPNLKLLLAHGGGTLPYLSGRLDDFARIYSKAASRPKYKPSDYLRRLYYDATVFHTPAIRCAIDFVGPDRLLFGTDHPFLKDPAEVYKSIERLEQRSQLAIRDGNARSLFHI